MEEPPKHPAVAALFAELLTATKLNAAGLAKKLGITPQAISNYIVGRNEPGRKMMAGIIKAFPAINAVWLATGEGDPFPNGVHGEKQKPVAPTDPTTSVQTEPDTTPVSVMRVNRDDESTDYWRGLALERLDTIDFYKELLRGAYGIRPADEEEQQAEGQRKKEGASSNAADLKKTVDEIAQQYQYRIVAHHIGFAPAWMDEELETA